MASFMRTISAYLLPVVAATSVACGGTSPQDSCENFTQTLQSTLPIGSRAQTLKDDAGIKRTVEFAKEESRDACTRFMEKQSSNCQKSFADLAACLKDHDDAKLDDKVKVCMAESERMEKDCGSGVQDGALNWIHVREETVSTRGDGEAPQTVVRTFPDWARDEVVKERK